MIYERWMRLSKRAKSVLVYIAIHKRTHDGAAPTLRQIASACAIPFQKVSGFVDELVSAEFLKQPQANKKRSIEMVNATWGWNDARVLGDTPSFKEVVVHLQMRGVVLASDGEDTVTFV